MSDQNAPPPAPVIDLGGGGGDGNGDSGGTSSSGASAPNPEDLRRPYLSIILRLRLPAGMFSDLISRAASERWSADEFIFALSNAQQFNRLFPGIQSLIDEGMSVPQAVATWRGMSEGYEDALRDAGLWQFAKAKLSKKNIGLAITQGLDAEEVVFRFSIAEQAKRSEATRAAFNQILKRKGQAQLDKQGYLRLLLGKGDAQVMDIWEGVNLLEQLGPSGLKVREARRLAKGLGKPGQAVDVSDALAAVQRIQRTFGTQLLSDAGISTGDLALAALAEGLVKPKFKAKAAGVIAHLEQLERNRAAAAGAVDRTASFSRGGRPVSEAAPEPSYGVT